MRQLALWEQYTRAEVHQIFSPQTIFTPQAGTWGLQGIVRVPERNGDFVFFVTFGASQGSHDFEEEITEDGVLTWQSQPQQRLSSPMIQQLVDHDDLTSSIHLLLRTSKSAAYTYLGELGYLEHDPKRESPVYFTWQIMSWPPPPQLRSDLRLLKPGAQTPEFAVSPQGELVRVDPPRLKPKRGDGAGGGGRKQAVLPGQDAKNRDLGLAGELLVLTAEANRLRASGRPDLADKIVHVAAVEGDSAGYDIRSYNTDGSVRHIEVKTTRGPAENAFFISPNELRFSQEHPTTYVIFRLHGYSDRDKRASYYEIPGIVAASFDLQPSEYRARLKPRESTPTSVPRERLGN